MTMRRVLIAASAEIDGRCLALEPVYYPTLIGAYARAARGKASLVVAVPAAHATALRERLESEQCMDRVTLVDELPAASEADICIDLREVHVPSTLSAALRSTRGKLASPVWVVRERADIARAAATLERQDMYVVARYLVIPVARRLAHALLPGRITPNQVTAASCLFGVAAAIAPFVLPEWYGRLCAALFVHVSVTLDFTDGYLARLRGTDSRVGYWFDTVMDEVVKFALFISMAALVVTRGPTWAVPAAILVLLLYHVLTSNHWISKSLEQGDVAAGATPPAPRRRAGVLGMAHRAYERLNYLDVHVYVVALSLATGLEAAALVMFAAIYLYRFVRMLQLRLASPPAHS